jgi:MHS family proline/betaine transporter-like MFS transporter
MVGAVGCCSAAIGILAGSATGAVLASVMSEAALESWGWRIPFVLGLLVGLAGFFLRRGIHVEETARKAVRSPLIETFQNHRPLLLRLAALSVFNSVGFYVMFVYIVSWLQLADGIAPARALGINTISMALLPPVMVGTAWLSDRIGRRPVLLASTAFAFVAAWPLFWLMHSADDAVVLLGQLGFVLAVGTFIGCQPAIMVDRSGRGALYGDRGRLQRHPGRRGRPQSAGGDMAGRTHGQRLQPGLHDHGRRGRVLPGAALSGNLPGVVNPA